MDISSPDIKQKLHVKLRNLIHNSPGAGFLAASFVFITSRFDLDLNAASAATLLILPTFVFST